MSRQSVARAHQKIQELSWEPMYHQPVSQYGTDHGGTIGRLVAAHYSGGERIAAPHTDLALAAESASTNSLCRATPDEPAANGTSLPPTVPPSGPSNESRHFELPPSSLQLQT